MKNIKKITALLMTGIIAVAAFAPTALAAVSWNFSLQSTEINTLYGSCAVNRYLTQRYHGMASNNSYKDHYDALTENDAVISLFTYDTYEMVRKFQADEGLTVDGAVGTNTWGKMGLYVFQVPEGGEVVSISDVEYDSVSPDAILLSYYVTSRYGNTNYSTAFQKLGNLWSVRWSLADDRYFVFS